MNTAAFIPLSNPGWANRELNAKEIRASVDRWEKEAAMKPGYCITRYCAWPKRKARSSERKKK